VHKRFPGSKSALSKNHKTGRRHGEEYGLSVLVRYLQFLSDLLLFGRVDAFQRAAFIVQVVSAT
jgi:hypothetical protein